MGEERVAHALRSVLPRHVRLEVRGRGPLTVTIASTPLVAAWLAVGSPAAVRQATAQHPDVQLVVAPHFSEGASAAIRQADLGWLDERGGAEFAFGDVVVSRTGLPAQTRRQGGWTPATLGVAEALLTGTRATVTALRERTHASPHTLATALQKLTADGLLSASAARGRHSGRQVKEPHELLASYADAAIGMPIRHSLSVGVLWRDPVAELARFGARMDETGPSWAATSALAAAVQAPYQTQVAPWVVCVESRTMADLLLAAQLMNLQPMSGGRLELRSFPSPITQRLAERIGSVSVVPWPRSYADLRVTGVRGEGAADHLADVMLGPIRA